MNPSMRPSVVQVVLVAVLATSEGCSGSEQSSEPPGHLRQPVAPLAEAPATDTSQAALAAERLVPAACSYMGAEFRMGHWHDTGVEDESGSWQCVSRYLDVGESGVVPLPNTLAYYVVGRADEPRRLKLALQVNDPNDKATALKALSENAAHLALKALRVELPKQLRDAIAKGRDASATIAGHQVAVAREKFAQGGIKGGFSLRFIIDKL